MPQDPNLYGQPVPKKRKNNAGLSSSVDFAARLSSLISDPSSSSASNNPSSSTARSRHSKHKEDLFGNNSKGSKGERVAKHNAGSKLTLKDAASADEQETLARARRNMEEKARLYAAMKRGDYVPKQNENAPLIDFDRKWAETASQTAPSSGSDDSHDDDGDEDHDGSNNVIIEYEDEFGRARRGTRAEIEQLERRQRRGLLGAEELERMSARPVAPANLIHGDAIQTLAFVPEDSEKMEELAHKRDRSATPPEMKHYDAESEIRTKGTGFYKFSRDEETRKAEMQSLEQERKQTEQHRLEQEEKKTQRRKELEQRRRDIEDRRAKKMADTFLTGLAADIERHDTETGTGRGPTAG